MIELTSGCGLDSLNLLSGAENVLDSRRQQPWSVRRAVSSHGMPVVRANASDMENAHKDEKPMFECMHNIGI